MEYRPKEIGYLSHKPTHSQIANSGCARAALPNNSPDAFEATAEYEDVTDAPQPATVAAPKAPTVKGRECPV